MTIILFAIALTHVLAIASPGPTFVIVSSHALAGEMRAGLLVTVGVLLATLTWATMAAAGLGTLLSQQPLVYAALKWASCAYLAWLGFKMLRSSWHGTREPLGSVPVTSSGWASVRAGFATNMSNPKVAAYYASLFGVTIPADAPPIMFVSAVAIALAVSALWWVFITVFFSTPVIRKLYIRSRRTVDAIMGGILLGLAGRLAVSR